jgi:hypothetical protein
LWLAPSALFLPPCEDLCDGTHAIFRGAPVSSVSYLPSLVREIPQPLRAALHRRLLAVRCSVSPCAFALLPVFHSAFRATLSVASPALSRFLHFHARPPCVAYALCVFLCPAKRTRLGHPAALLASLSRRVRASVPRETSSCTVSRRLRALVHPSRSVRASQSCCRTVLLCSLCAVFNRIHVATVRSSSCPIVLRGLELVCPVHRVRIRPRRRAARVRVSVP